MGDVGARPGGSLDQTHLAQCWLPRELVGALERQQAETTLAPMRGVGAGSARINLGAGTGLRGAAPAERRARRHGDEGVGQVEIGGRGRRSVDHC